VSDRFDGKAVHSFPRHDYSTNEIRVSAVVSVDFPALTVHGSFSKRDVESIIGVFLSPFNLEAIQFSLVDNG
jgi:hypothetical protein